MEREILFRGKRVDNGEQVEGCFVKYQPYASEDKLIHGIVPEYASDLYLVEIIPETREQYTGLTDKNGNRIFEGDIVRLENRSPEGSWTAVVEFGNPNCTYSWGYQLKRIGGEEGFNPDILLWVDMEETGATCEVIGNIYDNPELLEGEEK